MPLPAGTRDSTSKPSAWAANPPSAAAKGAAAPSTLTKTRPRQTSVRSVHSEQVASGPGSPKSRAERSAPSVSKTQPWYRQTKDVAVPAPSTTSGPARCGHTLWKPAIPPSSSRVSRIG